MLKNATIDPFLAGGWGWAVTFRAGGITIASSTKGSFTTPHHALTKIFCMRLIEKY